jgi:hypothetical protein
MSLKTRITRLERAVPDCPICHGYPTTTWISHPNESDPPPRVPEDVAGRTCACGRKVDVVHTVMTYASNWQEARR